jgi:hypothetical protein
MRGEGFMAKHDKDQVFSNAAWVVAFVAWAPIAVSCVLSSTIADRKYPLVPLLAAVVFGCVIMLFFDNLDYGAAGILVWRLTPRRVRLGYYGRLDRAFTAVLPCCLATAITAVWGSFVQPKGGLPALLAVGVIVSLCCGVAYFIKLRKYAPTPRSNEHSSYIGDTPVMIAAGCGAGLGLIISRGDAADLFFTAWVVLFGLHREKWKAHIYRSDDFAVLIAWLLFSAMATAFVINYWIGEPKPGMEVGWFGSDVKLPLGVAACLAGGFIGMLVAQISPSLLSRAIGVPDPLAVQKDSLKYLIGSQEAEIELAQRNLERLLKENDIAEINRIKHRQFGYFIWNEMFFLHNEIFSRMIDGRFRYIEIDFSRVKVHSLSGTVSLALTESAETTTAGSEPRTVKGKRMDWWVKVKNNWKWAGCQVVQESKRVNPKS